ISYFHSGGRVFLAFDPLQSKGSADEFLQNFGVKIQTGIVHMDENALAASGSILVSGLVKDPKDPMMQGLGSDSVVIFYVTGAIQSLETNFVAVNPLLVSPETALLRDGYTKTDKVLSKGPFNLLVAVTDLKNSGGQAFIAADGDLFSNQFLYQH